MSSAPPIEFCRLIPDARFPVRADRSGAGLIPSRAMRYCEALTTATEYGFWIFPPIDLRLLFDGEQIWWSPADEEDWLALTATQSGAVQFPGYSATFDSVAPEALRGYAPPFMAALPETGQIQIWTGLLAKTAPGWSLAIRAPVNLPPIPGLSAWEGVIETDLWCGPLFSNFRITKTDTEIHLHADRPFLQVQPLPQLAYSDEVHDTCVSYELSALTSTDWSRLAEVLLPSPDAEARQGSYSVAVRKRRIRRRPIAASPDASDSSA